MKQIGLILVLIFLSSCSRPRSQLLPINEATLQVQHAMQTLRAPSETPSQVPTVTSSPQPTSTTAPPTTVPTATPCTIFVDVSCDDPDLEALTRAFNMGWVPACQEEPLGLCPESKVLRHQMFVSIIRYEHGLDYEPPAALGFFWDLPYNTIRGNPELERIAAYAEQLWRERMTAGCSTERPESCYFKRLARAESAVFLLRMLYVDPEGKTMYAGPTAECSLFADVPRGVWYNKWVCEFASSVFYDVRTQGLEGFRPLEPVTVRDLARWFYTADQQRGDH